MLKFLTDQTITNHSSNKSWNLWKQGERYSDNLNCKLTIGGTPNNLVHEQVLCIFPIDSRMLVPQKLKARFQKQTSNIHPAAKVNSKPLIYQQSGKQDEIKSTYRIYLDCLIVVNGSPRYTYKCHRFLRVSIIR